MNAIEPRRDGGFNFLPLVKVPLYFGRDAFAFSPQELEVDDNHVVCIYSRYDRSFALSRFQLQFLSTGLLDANCLRCISSCCEVALMIDQALDIFWQITLFSRRTRKDTVFFQD